MNTKDEILKLKELGDEIGYGHLMSLASALWRQSLQEKGYPVSGAFIPALEASVDKEMLYSAQHTKKNYDEIVAKALNTPLSTYSNTSTISFISSLIQDTPTSTHKIIDAKLVDTDKRKKIIGGRYITFLISSTHATTITENSYVDVIVDADKRIHHFQVQSIIADTNNTNLLIVEAIEVGYWLWLLNTNKGFDLKTLIGLDVTEVTDVAKINAIREESLWT